MVPQKGIGYPRCDNGRDVPKSRHTYVVACEEQMFRVCVIQKCFRVVEVLRTTLCVFSQVVDTHITSLTTSQKNNSTGFATGKFSQLLPCLKIRTRGNVLVTSILGAFPRLTLLAHSKGLRAQIYRENFAANIFPASPSKRKLPDSSV